MLNSKLFILVLIACFFMSCVDKTHHTLTVNINTQKTAVQYLKDQLISSDLQTAVQNTAEFLKQQSNVIGVVITEDDLAIFIQYNSGPEGIIISSSYDPAQNNLQKNMQSIEFSYTVSSAISNCKAILMKPLTGIEYSGPEALKSMLDQKMLESNVRLIEGSEVTPELFTDLGDYDLIYFAGHGSAAKDNSKYGVKTGAPYTESNYNKYTQLGYDPDHTMAWMSADNEELTFGINQEFIKRFCRNIKASAVYFDSCNSLKNTSFAKAWYDNGAKSYLGWSWFITPFFPGMKNVCVAFFNNFTANQTAFEAYSNLPLDWNIADLKFYGNQDVKLSCELEVTTTTTTSSNTTSSTSLSSTTTTVGAGTWSIPDTGQTKCYDSDSEIPCPSPGDPFYGQDGNYTRPRGYTDLGNGIIRDDVTGLMWQKYSPSGTYTWQQAFDYCSNLSLGSYDDWRLPAINELSTLVNSNILSPGPTIDTAYFPNTVSGAASVYWSSTTFADGINHANVGFYDGGVGNYYRSSGDYVRAVRGGQSSNHFIDNGDGTVSDTSTGLMWQQATAPDTYTWEQALAYCKNLSLGGHNDWRLPDRNELQSLVNYSILYPGPTINISYFPDTVAFTYWSSTTVASNSNTYAWDVDFSYGIVGYYHDKVVKNYVRAVRSIQ